MTSLLVTVSVLVATVALAKGVLDFRGPGRMPLACLVRDRFHRTPNLRRDLALGTVLGGGVVVVPLVIFAAAGWTELRFGDKLSAGVLMLTVRIVGAPLAWASWPRREP